MAGALPAADLRGQPAVRRALYMPIDRVETLQSLCGRRIQLLRPRSRAAAHRQLRRRIRLSHHRRRHCGASDPDRIHLHALHRSALDSCCALQALLFDWSVRAGRRAGCIAPRSARTRCCPAINGSSSGCTSRRRRSRLPTADQLGGAHSNHLHALAAAGQPFGFATVGLLRGEAQDTPTVRDLQAFGVQLHWLGYGGYRRRHSPDFWQLWRERYLQLLPVDEGGGGLLAARSRRGDRRDKPGSNWVCWAGPTTTRWLAAGTGNHGRRPGDGRTGRAGCMSPWPCCPGMGWSRPPDMLGKGRSGRDRGYRCWTPAAGRFLAKVDARLAQLIDDLASMYGVCRWSLSIPARRCWHCATRWRPVTLLRVRACSCSTPEACRGAGHGPTPGRTGRSAENNEGQVSMTEPLNPEQLRSFTPAQRAFRATVARAAATTGAAALLAGQLLFRQGDQARTTYYLLSGELLLRDAVGGEERLQAGSEASCHPLSPSLPRQHEVRALSDASVLMLDLGQPRSSAHLAPGLPRPAARSGGNGDDVEWLERLLENPLFTKVPLAMCAMLDRLRPIDLPAGSRVLVEGEAGDCCYFLKSGRAEVFPRRRRRSPGAGRSWRSGPASVKRFGCPTSRVTPPSP